MEWHRRGGKSSVILVTYFDPFGEDPVNVSREVATRLLPREYVLTRELATSKQDVERQLPALIRQVHPQAILSLGQAQGRPVPTLERVGINLLESRIADNRGEIYHDHPVAASGPDAYFSTLPLKKLQDAVHARGYPLELSLSAGTFMCNQALYLSRHTAPEIPAGFLHLPLLPSQAVTQPKVPTMGLHDQLAVLNALLDALWQWAAAPR